MRHRLPEPLSAVVERAKWAARGHLARRDAPLVDPRLAEMARVLIGPANFAGQGLAWATALGRAGVPAVCWAYVSDDRFGFGADYRAPIGINGARAESQRDAFEQVAQTVEAVVIEAGRPLFGSLFGYDPVAEGRALRARGVRTALLWHGTDIRLPSVHRATHPQSPFADPAHRGRTRDLEAVAVRNRSRLARFDGPVLVSTPDLVDAVPGALWCPVIVDPSAWTPRPTTDDGPPVVVHLPSNRWLKGTSGVLAALGPLADEGLIELVVAEGVSSDAVVDLYRKADVVVDQFGLGIYGVAACEVMALGTPLISGVDDAVVQSVRRSTGHDLPIARCQPDELADLVRCHVADPYPLRALGLRGPGFVREVHDGRRSAAVLRVALDL